MKLTKKAIDRVRYEGDGQSRDVRWDDQLPGFGVRVFPTGRKSFVLSYRSNGRKRLMTLGAYGVLTLDQARDKARSLLGDVIDGKDPLQERQKEARGQKIKDLCVAYLQRHAKPHKKTWKTDESRINNYILPAWKGHKISAITRSDVAALHHKIGQKTPIEANRVHALVSIMFELARQWGFVDENHINPSRDIQMFKEKKRDRWVRPDELPRLAQAIDKEQNIYIRTALWTYLLVGTRKRELLRVKWSDLDKTRRELRLEDTKAGKTQFVPLNDPAFKLLTKLPRLADNPYIFIGKISGRPLVNIDRTWRRVRKEAGLEDVRFHDLRRTVGSWMANSGRSLHLIGTILRHSRSSVTEVYARFHEDAAREALEAHGKQIMGIAGKSPVAKVIEIPKKRKGKKRKVK